MILSGLVILAFLVLHFIDFWFPEISVKYINGDMSGMHDGEFRYFHELQEKFLSPLRVGAYVVAFVLLALHLMHGFIVICLLCSLAILSLKSVTALLLLKIRII